MYNHPTTGIAGWIYVPLAIIAVLVFLGKKLIIFIKKMKTE